VTAEITPRLSPRDGSGVRAAGYCRANQRVARELCLVARIRQVPGWKQHTADPPSPSFSGIESRLVSVLTWHIPWFFSVIPDKCRDDILKRPLELLPSCFPMHQTSPHYVACTSENASLNDQRISYHWFYVYHSFEISVIELLNAVCCTPPPQEAG
jgi:hypothetical protein